MTTPTDKDWFCSQPGCGKLHSEHVAERQTSTPTDTRAESEAVLEHLRHMVEVRPQGLDRDAAKWALERIASLSAQLAEARAKIGRYEAQSLTGVAR